jgi:hypothetical protein
LVEAGLCASIRQNKSAKGSPVKQVLLELFVFFLDMTLKFALAMLLVLIIWLPFGICGDVAIGRPWYIAGLVLGLVLNGLWERCDVFGLQRLFGLRG